MPAVDGAGVLLKGVADFHSGGESQSIVTGPGLQHLWQQARAEAGAQGLLLDHSSKPS